LLIAKPPNIPRQPAEIGDFLRAVNKRNPGHVALPE